MERSPLFCLVLSSFSLCFEVYLVVSWPTPFFPSGDALFCFETNSLFSRQFSLKSQEMEPDSGEFLSVFRIERYFRLLLLFL